MSKVIDIHAHVFNIKFLPLAGTIQGIGRSYYDTEIPGFGCRLAAAALLKWADRKEYEYNPLAVVSQPSTPDDLEVLFETILDSSDYNEILTEEEGKEIEFFYRENFRDSSIEELNLSQKQLDQLNISDTAQVSFLSTRVDISLEMKNNYGYFRSLAVSTLKKLQNSKPKLYINWLIILTDKYEVITKKLYAQYPEIGLFIHHDMDMDDWYKIHREKGATYPYETEQVGRIKKLMIEEKGKLLSFYAYNPDSEYGISKLKEAILEIDSSGKLTIGTKGYIGVKFYPASGYKPWYEGNELKDSKLALRQKNNKELYDFCATHHIPILTHCNYGGMQPNKCHFRFGDVKYWKRVLSQTDYHSLKICFGHAGGQGPWIGDFKAIEKLADKDGDIHTNFEESYPGQIFDLSLDHPNIYVDFGYYPDVANANSAAQKSFIKRLKLCIEKSKTKKLGYNFSERIMYGTDWHMLLQEQEYKDYYSEFKKLFNVDKLKYYKNLFFYQNALNFLNIKEYLAPDNKYILASDAKKYIEDKFFP